MGGALGGETALRSVGPLQVTPNQQGQKGQGPVLAPERTGMQLSPLPSKCCHPLTQLGPELEMKQDSVESNGLERWCLFRVRAEGERQSLQERPYQGALSQGWGETAWHSLLA